jgi:hypothetical protein
MVSRPLEQQYRMLANPVGQVARQVYFCHFSKRRDVCVIFYLKQFYLKKLMTDIAILTITLKNSKPDLGFQETWK